ncbi:MAG TPA: hypothetical protein VMA30_04895 [Xanthobacteraceae bacterium]|nr:hypothetical protein [Xanthobacteraceae bacterium]
MRLQRVGTSAHGANSREYRDFSIYDVKIDGLASDSVNVDFSHFGRGEEKTSDFTVSLDWTDVEEIIETFAKMGKSEAVRLARAIRLADAVSELVKISN